MHSKQLQIQDKKVLGIAVVLIILIAVVAAWIVVSGGESGPVDDMVVDDGDEKTINEDTIVRGDLEVRAGGKLTIADGATLTLTGKESKLTNAGIFDATGGTIQFANENEDGTLEVLSDNSDGGSRSVSSTGTLMVTDNNFSHQDGMRASESGIINFVDSAVYTDPAGYIVITSVAGAAGNVPDGQEALVLGSFEETGTASIDGGSVLVIGADADVTVGTIVLSSAQLRVEGTLTGSVAVGASDSRDSASLGSVSGLTAEGVSESGSQRLYLSGKPTGTMSVTTGTVFTGTLSIDGTVMTVMEGATLQVGTDEGRYFEVGATGTGNASAALVVNGTFVVDGGDLRDYHDATTDSDRQVIDLNGTMSIPADSEVAIEGRLNVTGTGKVLVLGTLSTEGTGSIESKGVIEVGQKPTVLSSASSALQGRLVGNVTTSSTGYIKDYSTANPFQAPAAMHSTEFSIDGIEYMTVHTSGDVTISSVLSGETFAIEGLDGTKLGSVTNWYTTSDLQGISLSATSKVTDNSHAYYKSDVAIVEIKVTLCEGATLSIDGNNLSSSQTIRLAAGEHTVAAQVSEGYTGTPTITFGELVGDGTITVSASAGSPTEIKVEGVTEETETTEPNQGTGGSGEGLR